MSRELQIPAGSYSELVTAPAVPLLSLAEAKTHLRVYFDDDDADITAYAKAASEMLDASYGELGRALTTQTWRLTMPRLPSSRFDLPVPPVQSISSITYYDADDTLQTLSASTYRLTSLDEFARVDRVDGQDWPSTYARHDAVIVDYVTGYGAAASDVPEGIRHAARLMAGHWYRNREAVSETRMSNVPLGVRQLLHKFRVTRGFI